MLSSYGADVHKVAVDGHSLPTCSSRDLGRTIAKLAFATIFITLLAALNKHSFRRHRAQVRKPNEECIVHKQLALRHVGTRELLTAKTPGSLIKPITSPAVPSQDATPRHARSRDQYNLERSIELHHEKQIRQPTHNRDARYNAENVENKPIRRLGTSQLIQANCQDALIYSHMVAQRSTVAYETSPL